MADGLTWAIHFHDFTTAHGISPLNTFVENFHEDYMFQEFFTALAAGQLTNYTFLVPQLNPIVGNVI